MRAFSDLSVWTLAISPEKISAPQLTSHLTGDFPGGWAIVLHDAVIGEVIDMTGEAEYIIPHAVQMPEGRFTILAGDEERVYEALGRMPGMQPRVFRVYQNYPNPFNAATTISYDLPAPGMVSVEVFNLLGQKVAVVEQSYKNAGSYQVTWDGYADGGDPTASGIYFARITAGQFSGTTKMILLK
jgi:hypothetical protein